MKTIYLIDEISSKKVNEFCKIIICVCVGGGGGVGGHSILPSFFYKTSHGVCVQYLTFFGGEAKYLTFWV